VFFIFFIFIFVSDLYAIPPGYISPDNGYCDENTTKDEYVEVWWSNVGGQMVQAQWNVKMTEFITMAQRVAHRTLDYPEPPFVYKDDNAPWDNGDPWSDTWGVCAYFILLDFHPNSVIGPDPIWNELDVNIWHNSTVNLSPESTWRIVGVDDIVPGFIGWTKPLTKLCVVEKNVENKIYLHEWGHCFEPECDGDWNATKPNGNGIYNWGPLTQGLAPHYGHYVNEATGFWWQVFQPWYALNIMHFNPECGTDGDYNWRHEKYPWYYWHYYDSFRWDENY
jgi:hypothetical protein